MGEWENGVERGIMMGSWEMKESRFDELAFDARRGELRTATRETVNRGEPDRVGWCAHAQSMQWLRGMCPRPMRRLARTKSKEEMR